MSQADTPILKVGQFVLFVVLLPLIMVQVAHGLFTAWSHGTATVAQWCEGVACAICVLLVYVLVAVRPLRDWLENHTLFTVPWRQMPELKCLPAAEQRRLWSEAKRDPWKPRDFIYFVGIFSVVLLMAFLLVPDTPWFKSAAARWVFAMGLMLACNEVVQTMIFWRYRPVVKKLLAGGE